MIVTIGSRFLRSATAGVLAVAFVPAAAGARVEGVRVLPRVGPVTHSATPATSNVWHAAKPGPHVLYGTIAALSGTQLSVRLRSGQLVAVDGTAAINGGNFSAPLFVGKVVTVDGAISGGKFTATHIFRMSNLADLPADR